MPRIPKGAIPASAMNLLFICFFVFLPLPHGMTVFAKVSTCKYFESFYFL
jgi:hypothetical protein